MTLFERMARARVFDLEQPRFAGMPIHPAHKPGYFYALHRRHRDSYRPDQHGPRTDCIQVPVSEMSWPPKKS
jgi:hypothetical protein